MPALLLLTRSVWGEGLVVARWFGSFHASDSSERHPFGSGVCARLVACLTLNAAQDDVPMINTIPGRLLPPAVTFCGSA